MMKVFRKRHDLVYKLLKFCECEENEKPGAYHPKKYLANLFASGFYLNILSSSFIETDLLIIFVLTLNNEISNLTNEPKLTEFLKENSINTYMIRELIKMDDIKSYFKIVLQDLIEKIDNKEATSTLTLDVNKMKIQSQTKQAKSTIRRTTTGAKRGYTMGENYKHNNKVDQEKEDDNILENYSKSVLEQKMESEKNEGMKEYLLKQMATIKEDEGLFGTDKFLNKLHKVDDYDDLEDLYKQNFIKFKKYVNEVFNNLDKNIGIIPYSIRCISKIISILIKKKYPSIKDIDRNAFISLFFFEGLLQPLMKDPEINGTFTIFITEETKKVLILIYKIVNKLVSGEFFTSIKDLEYTTFNKFFYESMPKVMKFFNSLINVELPTFITKLLNGEEKEENFFYDYFKENPKECIKHWSNCFCIEDIIQILTIIKKHENEFIVDTIRDSNKDYTDNLLKKIYERFTSTDFYINLLNNIKKQDDKQKQRTFVLFTDVEYNEQMTKLSKIDFSSPSHMIKEKKGNEQENNLIKCKNFLNQILFNFQELNEEMFTSTQILTTENILKCLQNFLQTDYYLFYNSVPIEWCGRSLIALIKNIPEEYQKKDYFKFYEELTQNVEDSIKLLDIRELGKIQFKLNYTRRTLKNIKESVTKIKQWKLNSIIQKFINETPIEIIMNKNFDDPKNKFTIKDKEETSIKSIMALNKILNVKNAKIKGSITSIRKFTREFPNFVKMPKDEFNLFKYEEKLGVNEALDNYLKVVKKVLSKDKALGAYYEEGYRHIYNYLMNTLYPKLYADESSKDDLKIYEQCVQLSWIEPNNLISGKNLLLDNFLHGTVGYILKLDKEKSPLKKILLIKEVFQVIQSTLVFSTGRKDNSVDDILPLLQYAIIKAQPKKLASNAAYIDLFLDREDKQKELGLVLTQLQMTVETLKNFSVNKLFDVTEEEYQRYLYII